MGRRLEPDRSRFRIGFERPPAVAAEYMVSTSHPAATRAGLRAFERGGNASDAALSAAAALCIAEPMNCGVGGDAIALVWNAGRGHVLDAAGPAPARARASRTVAPRGPESVTVPGAVAGWAELAERFGRLGFDRCLADAIDLARDGVALGVRTAAIWARESCPAEFGPRQPGPGERLSFPELGRTLELIAEDGPAAVYRGRLAEGIAAVSSLDEDDLARFQPRWVKPLSCAYRGHEVLEPPPPTQGIAVLEALSLLQPLEPSLPNQVQCMRLALDDACNTVRDGAEVTGLLEPAYLQQRAAQQPAPVPAIDAGTSYACAVDRDGTGVSLIQSLFGGFGSGVVVPGYSVVLQNRGACFAVNGAIEPARRPFHTIIPGLLARDGRLVATVGVVGGLMQAQGQAQVISGVLDDELDPQRALDRPRFRVDGNRVRLEEGLWTRAEELEEQGLATVRDGDWIKFGAGQMITVQDDCLLGGSDSRMDGFAAGA